MKTLDGHVKFIFDRDLMEVLAVAGAGVQLSRFHLKDPDILGLGLPVEIVFMHTGGDAFHEAFATGYIEGIAVEDVFPRGLGADLRVQIGLNLGQTFQAGHRLFFFLFGHQPVILLEILLPLQGQFLAAPCLDVRQAAGDQRGATGGGSDGEPLQEVSAAALSGHGSISSGYIFFFFQVNHEIFLYSEGGE